MLSVRNSALQLLVRVAWLGDPPQDPSDDVLDAALELARRNEVDALLVRAYQDRLPERARALDVAVEAYRRNLDEACRRLDEAGVRPVLIKALPEDDYTYTNFDLVVGDDGWEAAEEALRKWVDRTSMHPLERRTKLLLYPPQGPAVHLHRIVAWFDVPAIPTDRLRTGAHRPPGSPCLLPSPTEAFRVLLAHAVFQNLALTIGELRTYRSLLTQVDVAEAAREAREEGWGRGFKDAFKTAKRAMSQLDRLEPPRLPVTLPISGSLLCGFEHALYLTRSGCRRTAIYEIALRGPLVAAKRRAARRP